MLIFFLSFAVGWCLFITFPHKLSSSIQRNLLDFVCFPYCRYIGYCPWIKFFCRLHEPEQRISFLCLKSLSEKSIKMYRTLEICKMRLTEVFLQSITGNACQFFIEISNGNFFRKGVNHKSTRIIKQKIIHGRIFGFCFQWSGASWSPFPVSLSEL